MRPNIHPSILVELRSLLAREINLPGDVGERVGVVHGVAP